VDLYFDTTDEALATSNGTGNFTGTVSIPASAVPGTHFVTAAGRHTGLSAQAPFAVSTDWAQFRYSARHKGASPFENVLSAGNVSRMDDNWKFATTTQSLLSAPAVAGGTVYVGANDFNVYAVSAATGAKLWSFATGSVVESSPAVANGLVYAGAGNGSLYALSAATGGMVWSMNTGGAVESSPAVVNGVVYVGSDSGEVSAFNATDGTPLWQFSTGGSSFFSSPAVSNGNVYIGAGDGDLYSFGLAGGTATIRRPAAARLHPDYSLRERAATR
jgi:outer membrane protein assembly factor BamB